MIARRLLAGAASSFIWNGWPSIEFAARAKQLATLDFHL
jgi:hypothetical protein